MKESGEGVKWKSHVRESGDLMESGEGVRLGSQVKESGKGVM